MKKRLFIFNPDCELAIANGGKYYMPPANIMQMNDDLAFLPAYLGGEGDFVLLQRPLDKTFRKYIESLNISCKDILETDIKGSGIQVGEPWGQSPKMNHWLTKRGLGQEWEPKQKDWYSRKTARQGLMNLIEKMPFLEADIVPRICYSVSEIEQQADGGEYLVKAPWSSSGKGLLTLDRRVGTKEKEWLTGMMRRQGYLMLEKKWNKVQDFAMEFCVKEENTEFIGWSSFTTGTNGEYRGNYIGSQENIEQQLIKYLGKEKFSVLKCEIPLMLKELLPAYRGYLGVDMMIYQNFNGEYSIQPCVEINLRYNMGIIALNLTERYVNEGIKGQFEICFYSRKGEALQEWQRLWREKPVVYKNNRILSGYLNLTPVNETTCFVASVRCY